MCSIQQRFLRTPSMFGYESADVSHGRKRAAFSPSCSVTAHCWPCAWTQFRAPSTVTRGQRSGCTPLTERTGMLYSPVHVGEAIVQLSSCRDVWKIYLEQGHYERAKQYAEVNYCAIFGHYTDHVAPFAGKQRTHGHHSHSSGGTLLQAGKVSCWLAACRRY